MHVNDAISIQDMRQALGDPSVKLRCPYCKQSTRPKSSTAGVISCSGCGVVLAYPGIDQPPMRGVKALVRGVWFTDDDGNWWEVVKVTLDKVVCEEVNAQQPRTETFDRSYVEQRLRLQGDIKAYDPIVGIDWDDGISNGEGRRALGGRPIRCPFCGIFINPIISGNFYGQGRYIRCPECDAVLGEISRDRPRTKCMQGRNRGKPGPCPQDEGQVVATPDGHSAFATYQNTFKTPRKFKAPRVLPYKAPPAPQGKAGQRKAGGFSATGRTNTEVGDAIEKALTSFGFVPLNDKRQGKLDFRYKGSNMVFELKGVTTKASHYKVRARKREVEEKKAWARKRRLKLGTILAVADYDKGRVYAYWKEGLDSGRLIPHTGHKHWYYMGATKL